MSKVLLIEPDKMLRQAFMVALFPEFQIEVVEAMPDAEPKDFDAMIVDAAALQGREPELASKIRAVVAWRLPIIWIDGDRPAHAPDRAKCIRLRRPVAKEVLCRALAQCLNATAGPNSHDSARAEPTKTPLRKRQRTRKATDSVTGEGRKIIDLVDVVEEGVAR